MVCRCELLPRVPQSACRPVKTSAKSPASFLFGFIGIAALCFQLGRMRSVRRVEAHPDRPRDSLPCPLGGRRRTFRGNQPRLMRSSSVRTETPTVSSCVTRIHSPKSENDTALRTLHDWFDPTESDKTDLDRALGSRWPQHSSRPPRPLRLVPWARNDSYTTERKSHALASISAMNAAADILIASSLTRLLGIQAARASVAWMRHSSCRWSPSGAVRDASSLRPGRPGRGSVAPGRVCAVQSSKSFLGARVNASPPVSVTRNVSLIT